MIPMDISHFQPFYEKEIIPVLSEWNARRIYILRWIGIMVLGLVFGFLLNRVFQLFAITILISGVCFYGLFYAATLGIRFRRDRQVSLTTLMMKYFMQTPEIMDVSFEVNQSIPKELYLESGFFSEDAAKLTSYGLLKGKVGETSFSLAELNVLKSSKLDNTLKTQFKGYFIHGKLPFRTTGTAIIWTRKEKQEVSGAIRKFTWLGAENKDVEEENVLFREYFVSYASAATAIRSVLSDDIKQWMIAFHRRTGKSLYFSFVDQDLYAAISVPENLFPMPLLKKFSPEKSILTFLEVHLILFSILQDFDIHH
jgi:hypothetical protein